MVALAGLVVHGSQLYVVKIREQRTADFAVQAAAGVANAISGGAPSAAAVAAARNIAEVNGFSPSETIVSVSGGNQLTVELSNPYATMFAATSTNRATVISRSTAKPTLTAPPCVIAVGEGTSIVDNSTLKAACGVIAAKYLTVENSSMNASAAAVGFSRLQEELEIRAPVSLSPMISDFVFNNTASDPLAGDTRILALDAKLDQMSGGWPYAKQLPVTLMQPSVQSGTDRTFDGVTSVMAAGARIGKLIVAGSTLTFLNNGADPNCTRPTTIAGDTIISRGSTILMNSGCYIFKGNISLEDLSSSLFALSGAANVKIVVQGQIINRAAGQLFFPVATYSIAGGIINPDGGRIELGAGPKVIGGTIDNGHSILNLGRGPHYLEAATVRQGTGTITFGSGPTYIYSSSIVNGTAGTLKFGAGPHYIAGSSITNGDANPGTPLVSFVGGPYYLIAATITNNGTSMMTLGPGDMELYQSTFAVRGGTFTYGPIGSTASGQISMVESSFGQTAGTFRLNGVTIAAKASTVLFNGSVVQALAPTGVNPAYGIRNLVLYSQSNGISFNTAAGAQQLAGVVYAPRGPIDFLTGKFSPPTGCLAIVGGTVNVWRGASVSASACSDFPWPAANAGTSKLLN